MPPCSKARRPNVPMRQLRLPFTEHPIPRIQVAEVAGMSGKSTHGHTRGAAGNRKASREYHSWCALRARCENEKSAKYPRYGGRGIKVCARWQRFENFLEDMGLAPPDTTIDRVDNDGDYEPGNCRWATAKQQRANRPHAQIARRTHCPSGHEYSGDNLRLIGERQKCRSCDRLRAQANRDRAKVVKP